MGIDGHKMCTNFMPHTGSTLEEKERRWVGVGGGANGGKRERKGDCEKIYFIDHSKHQTTYAMPYYK